MWTYVRWALPVVVCGIALARAATVRASETLVSASEADKRLAFTSIASREPQMRHEAAKNFPTDHWSQDDDFHSQERRAASDFARPHRIPLGDALEAIDDGMREHWTPAANLMRATVPPCQPRAIY